MKHRLVSAAMADGLLRYLLENFAIGQYVTCSNVNKMLAETGLDFNELNALLTEFGQMGLIAEPNVRQIAIHIEVTRRLHAFVEAGGFGGELAKLKTELSLLKAELDGLGQQQAQTVSTSINNVLQILQSVGLGLLGKY